MTRLQVGSGLVCAFVVLAILAGILFGERSEFPVVESVWRGSNENQLSGESAYPIWSGVLVNRAPGQDPIDCGPLYAPRGVRSDYAVIAYGSRATVTDYVLGSGGRAAMFRGYRPVGDFVKMTAHGKMYVWREFRLQCGYRADREAEEFAEGLDRSGFDDAEDLADAAQWLF